MSTSVPNEHEEHGSSERPSALTRVPVDTSWLDGERERRGWSKKLLALAMDVTPETLSDLYARGGTSPRTYAKLRAALDDNPPADLDVRLMGEPAEGAA